LFSVYPGSITAAQWMVIDNVKQEWNYWTNLDRNLADVVYLQCVSEEYIKDGKITPVGEIVLLTNGLKTFKKEQS
jgi:hypothetical protein